MTSAVATGVPGGAPGLGADVRFRLLTLVLLAAFALGPVDTTGGMAIALVWACVLFALSGPSPGDVARHTRRVLALSALVLVLNGVLVDGAPVVSWRGHGIVSDRGLSSGAFYGARFAVLYVVAVTFAAAAIPEEAAATVHALVRPFSRRLAGRAAFHAFVATGFVPLFADEFRRVRIAQSFRGLDLTGGLRRRARSARPLLVPLILSAVHRSGQLAVVSELRGLPDRVGAVARPARAGWRDVAVLATTVAVVIIAVTR